MAGQSLLVKQKRLAKTAPVPCVLRDVTSDILAEDDSLAENMQRVALHPLDQFPQTQLQDGMPEVTSSRNHGAGAPLTIGGLEDA